MTTDSEAAIVEAIENGATTNAAIAEATGLAASTVRVGTKALTEDRVLSRTRVGRSHEYSVTSGDDTATDGGAVTTSAPDTPEQTATATVAPTPAEAETEAATAADTTDHRMTVYRDDDWSLDIPNPDRVVPYVPVGPELDEIAVQVALREDFNHRPVFMLLGPTACGKTTLAQNIATGKLGEHASEAVRDSLGDKLDHDPIPYIEVQVNDQMVPADLFGSPTLVDGDTVWVDGPVTRAVRASRDGPVVLTLDEITRAPPQAKSSIFDLLDHRARVKLDGGRGGEVIEGDPSNLIIVATANVGTGHYVENMDIAEQRRWKDAWKVDYLGRVDADTDRDATPEADLLVSQTGAHPVLAAKLVSVANDIRGRADDNASPVNKKVPTGALLEWAEVAQMNAAGGLDNPISRAGRSAIVSVFYSEDGRGDVTDEVTSIINGEFDGVNDVDDHELLAAFEHDSTVNHLF